MAENVLEFNDGNFDSEVLQSDQPVLVDFWAPWCGPCRALSPTIEELATDYAGKVRVGKLNTDENQETAAKFGISAIPAVMVFKGGEVQQTIVGANPKQKYEEVLAAHA